MSITIPDPSLMLLIFVVFLITMFLLNAWLFKPLIGFMDERENSLRKDTESAMNNDSEVQEIHSRIQAIFADAKAQASKIIEEATTEAKANYDKNIAQKQSELQAKTDRFIADLETQKAQAREELLAELSGFESALKDKICAI